MSHWPRSLAQWLRCDSSAEKCSQGTRLHARNCMEAMLLVSSKTYANWHHIALRFLAWLHSWLAGSWPHISWTPKTLTQHWSRAKQCDTRPASPMVLGATMLRVVPPRIRTWTQLNTCFYSRFESQCIALDTIPYHIVPPCFECIPYPLQVSMVFRRLKGSVYHVPRARLEAIGWPDLWEHCSDVPFSWLLSDDSWVGRGYCPTRSAPLNV